MSEIPHHGPITRDCPPECLLALLSRKAWNPLMRGDITVSPPESVGDVLDLYARGQLSEIPGLGPRRISEIETALIFAGFDLTPCRHSARNHGQSPARPIEGKPEA